MNTVTMHVIKVPVSIRVNRLGFRSLVITVISGCIILISYLYYQSTEEEVSRATDQLRHSRILLQRAERQLQRLNDAGVHRLSRTVGEDVDVVQIRLAEFLRQYPISDDVSVQAFEQSILPVFISTASDTETDDRFPEFVKILRLNVDVSISHAPALLALLEELEQTLGGWPMDVRACDIRKTPQSRLNARCVVDIYYWQSNVDQ